MDFWASINASINWGDVPSWLSVIGATAVVAVGFFRRSQIFEWFRRATNAPPSFESQPSFVAEQDGMVMKVTNHGPGEAFDVRFTLEGNQWMTGLSFRGRFNWDSIDVDETVELKPTFYSATRARAQMSLVATWILRHDPGEAPVRDSAIFRIDVSDFFPEPEDPWGENAEPF